MKFALKEICNNDVNDISFTYSLLTKIDKRLTLQHLVACFLTICCHFIHYVIVVSVSVGGVGKNGVKAQGHVESVLFGRGLIEK